MCIWSYFHFIYFLYLLLIIVLLFCMKTIYKAQKTLRFVFLCPLCFTFLEYVYALDAFLQLMSCCVAALIHRIVHHPQFTLYFTFGLLISANSEKSERTVDYMACICLYFSGPKHCYQAPGADLL